MKRRTIKKERALSTLAFDWTKIRVRYHRLFSIPIVCILAVTCSHEPNVLDQIKEKGELHVVTLMSPTTFYQDGMQMTGPEYDLVNELANNLGVKLVIKVVDKIADIKPALESGKGHLAAAGVTPTENWSEDLSFGYPYANVDTHLIYKRGTTKPQSVENIVGRKIEITSEIDHEEALKELKIDYPNLTWSTNASQGVEELMSRVDLEEIDFTIADSNEFALQRHINPELRVALDLKKNKELAWVYKKKGTRELREQADNFLIEAEREGLVTQINERYYGHADALDYVDTRTFIEHVQSRLPKYKENFVSAGMQFDVDWRLLAAIGYQESHWQPRAISKTGVRGLMMLTLTTAKELNIKNRLDPASSIRGGAEYFVKQWHRLPETITEPDRSWFALAAYNVGYGHLKDAWQVAEFQGNDPTRWDNVSKSLPLLANKKWYPFLSHGYARGWEPVIYVNNIRSYYEILTSITDKEETVATLVEAPINISDAL